MSTTIGNGNSSSGTSTGNSTTSLFLSARNITFYNSSGSIVGVQTTPFLPSYLSRIIALENTSSTVDTYFASSNEINTLVGIDTSTSLKNQLDVKVSRTVESGGSTWTLSNSVLHGLKNYNSTSTIQEQLNGKISTTYLTTDGTRQYVPANKIGAQVLTEAEVGKLKDIETTFSTQNLSFTSTLNGLSNSQLQKVIAIDGLQAKTSQLTKTENNLAITATELQTNKIIATQLITDTLNVEEDATVQNILIKGLPTWEFSNGTDTYTESLSGPELITIKGNNAQIQTLNTNLNTLSNTVTNIQNSNLSALYMPNTTLIKPGILGTQALTDTELGSLKGVTSNIQSQFNSKVNTVNSVLGGTCTFAPGSSINFAFCTTPFLLSGTNKIDPTQIGHTVISAAEFATLKDCTSPIQTQINNINTILSNRTQYITNDNNYNTTIGGSIITGNVYAGGIINAVNMTASGRVTCTNLTIGTTDSATWLNSIKPIAKEYSLSRNQLLTLDQQYLPTNTTYNDTYVETSRDFISTTDSFFASNGILNTSGTFLITLSYDLSKIYSVKKILVKFSLLRREKGGSVNWYSCYDSLRHGFQNNGSFQYPNYGGSVTGITSISSSDFNTYEYCIASQVECDIFTASQSFQSQFLGRLSLVKLS